MKIPVLVYVWLATLLLIGLAVMSGVGMSFKLVFYTMCLGQCFVLIMVHRVLKDKYSTDKTFDNFYEDRPLDYKEE